MEKNQIPIYNKKVITFEYDDFSINVERNEENNLIFIAEYYKDNILQTNEVVDLLEEKDCPINFSKTELQKLLDFIIQEELI